MNERNVHIFANGSTSINPREKRPREVYPCTLAFKGRGSPLQMLLYLLKLVHGPDVATVYAALIHGHCLLEGVLLYNN